MSRLKITCKKDKGLHKSEHFFEQNQTLKTIAFDKQQLTGLFKLLSKENFTKDHTDRKIL